MKRLVSSPAFRWLGTAVLGAATGAVGWLLLREPPAGTDRVEPDLDRLRQRLGALADPDALRIRRLGPGIVELVGRVERPDVVPALLAEASNTDGIEVVVNRLWSPGKGRVVAANRPIDEPSAGRYSSVPDKGGMEESGGEGDVSSATEEGRNGG